MLRVIIFNLIFLIFLPFQLMAKEESVSLSEALSRLPEKVLYELALHYYRESKKNQEPKHISSKQMKIKNAASSSGSWSFDAAMGKLEKGFYGFEEVIMINARRFGLDKDLVAAIIKQESAFDPSAVSPKKAKGLMMIMPINYRHFNKDPLDPEQNIYMGCKLLATYLEDFDGDMELALAAYNAGPSAVKKARGIPNFEETKNYVKNVLRYYREYQKMADNERIALRE